MSNQQKRWVLRSPSGVLIVETLSSNRKDAERAAYEYLYKATRWAQNPEYSFSDVFAIARERRGWFVVKAHLTEGWEGYRTEPRGAW